jgi:hypothetical protein
MDEFLDLTAGGERLLAIATDDDAAHLIVRRQTCHHLGQLPPHRRIDGVALVRIGQGHRRNEFVLTADDFATHSCPSSAGCERATA